MVAQGYLGEAFDLGGWYKLTTPVTYDGLLPKRIATGLASRSVDRTTPDVLPLLTAGVGGTQIVEIYWRDIQPNDTNNWNVTKVAEITADIQQARDRGLNVVLRPFAGYYAPDWARALSGGSASGGGMYWYTNDGNLATGAPAPSNSSWKRMPRPMPCWWAPGYSAAYASFIQKISQEAAWMGNPVVCGVYMGGPSTQYVEPMVKQFALLENRQTAVAAGYTPALDQAAFISGFDACHTYLSPLKIATYCAFNYYQQVGISGGVQMVPSVTLDLMERMVDILGPMAVICNNSLQYPTNKYPIMYDRMKDFPLEVPPIAISGQTETQVKHEKLWDSQPAGAKLTSPYNTAKEVLSWGMSHVEMPTGWQSASKTGSNILRWPGVTVTQAAELNRIAWNNTVGRDEFHKEAA